MTLDDLFEIGEAAHKAVMKSPEGGLRRADLARTVAIVRALRDEMASGTAWHAINVILGSDAGEKVAEIDRVIFGMSVSKMDAEGNVTRIDPAALYANPATDAAPAVCEWTDYSVSSWKGSHRHDEEFWIRGCDASHTQKYAFDKPCPSCGKPIKFTEANHG